MTTAKSKASNDRHPRLLLARLVERLQRQPLKHLPERSVEGLAEFFAGYAMFGGPIWQELVQFDVWLRKHFYYPSGTGRWDRYIKLNSADDYDSYQLFFELYTKFGRKPSREIGPPDSAHELDPKGFDFYQWLYWMSLRPAMYFGTNASVQTMAAYFSGYFLGKKDAGLKISRDEQRFLRFEDWLWRSQGFKRRYPWHRLIAMWPYGGMNSVENFFAYFDAYLTNYGKKPRGLEELFEIVKDDKTTTFKRRKKLPKKLFLRPETRRWWRGYYWKPES